MHTSMKIIY